MIDYSAVSTRQPETGTSSASRAAFNRRAPMTTSYFVSSGGRTSKGSKTPCALKLVPFVSLVILWPRVPNGTWE